MNAGVFGINDRVYFTRGHEVLSGVVISYDYEFEEEFTGDEVLLKRDVFPTYCIVVDSDTKEFATPHHDSLFKTEIEALRWVQNSKIREAVRLLRAKKVNDAINILNDYLDTEHPIYDPIPF